MRALHIAQLAIAFLLLVTPVAVASDCTDQLNRAACLDCCNSDANSASAANDEAARECDATAFSDEEDCYWLAEQIINDFDCWDTNWENVQDCADAFYLEATGCEDNYNTDRDVCSTTWANNNTKIRNAASSCANSCPSS
jgi:hypothetical protein